MLFQIKSITNIFQKGIISYIRIRGFTDVLLLPIIIYILYITWIYRCSNSIKKLSIISENEIKIQNIFSKPYLCGKYENVVIVLSYCRDKIPLESLESLAKSYNITVEYTKCNLSKDYFEAYEISPMLRWIIQNWKQIFNGTFLKIIFHHAHENSWHQNNLTLQLNKLLKSYSYFWGRKYGEIYPHIVEHPLINEKVIYAKANIIDILDNFTSGTSFSSFNRSNHKNIWRSGQNSAFFIDGSLLLKGHTINDYNTLLVNLRKTILNTHNLFGAKSASYLVAECIERGWNALFTNKSYIDYKFPTSFGKSKIYNFNNNSRVPRIKIQWI